MTRLKIHAAAAPLFLELLRAIADAGGTPCTRDPAPFTSDNRAERAEAAAACGGCRVIEECRIYADAQQEPFHVWAGVDRTPTNRKKSNKENAA